MAMNSNNQQIVAEFDRCPACGSTRRLAGSVAEEQIEKGQMGTGWKYGLYRMGGPILDPKKVNQLLVGTRIPTVTALLDVCLDCGTVYAVRLERDETSLRAVMSQPPPQQGQPPGSAR